MSMSEVAKKLRIAHEKVDDVANRLRECVCVVPQSHTESWLNTVHKRFEHFRAHFTQHMALEEQEGFMVTVVEQRPTLSIEVDRLKREHNEMITMMKRISEAIHELNPLDRLLVHECCRRIENLLNDVDRHENDENLLLTFAFTHDIGTHD